MMDGALASVLLFFLYCEHSSLINLSANQHLIVWVFTGLVATNTVNYYDLFPTPTTSTLVAWHICRWNAELVEEMFQDAKY
jgi:hypothetical protein